MSPQDYYDFIHPDRFSNREMDMIRDFEQRRASRRTVAPLPEGPCPYDSEEMVYVNCGSKKRCTCHDPVQEPYPEATPVSDDIIERSKRKRREIAWAQARSTLVGLAVITAIVAAIFGVLGFAK